MMDAEALTGRSAIVTGASRGIGLAVARALAGAGARVAMLARRNGALAEAARAIGDRAVAIPCDVTDRLAVKRVCDRIQAEWGTPDILVSNAGLFELSTLAETDVEQFEAAVEVNLVAPFALIRAVLPAMRERGSGHLVMIGSIADRMAFPENGAYAASKFGARAMMEVARAELKGTGVRTTLVSPGPVDTPLWDALDPDARADLPSRAAMLSPERVAEAVLFVVSRAVDTNIDELRLSRS